MNIHKINNALYKYEGMWNYSSSPQYDFIGNPLSSPLSSDKKWNISDVFLNQLLKTQTFLFDNKKYKIISEHNKCILCNKKQSKKYLYILNGIIWDNCLVHYIQKHNVKPSIEFIDTVFKFQFDHKAVSITKSKNIKGMRIIKKNKVYLKLDRNQIFIMDALMSHGGKKIYHDSSNSDIYRYSEHAGLLDFNDDGLERLLVSGKTHRVDEGDNEIYLPKNMIDAFDYEYIFHTHPPTPRPGGRVNIGILYEFPSISDIFHFIDHYNDGYTQGSIVIAAEGLYIVHKNKYDNNKIDINEDLFYSKISNVMSESQSNAILQYGNKFTNNFFYSVIAQNTSFIHSINSVMQKFDMCIDYYPRSQDNKGRWIIDTIYLPVYVVEPSSSSF